MSEREAPTLADFLLARLAEDEAIARRIQIVGSCEPAYSPARVLADVAAKRAVVALHPTEGQVEDWMDEEIASWQRPYCAWCTYDARTVEAPCDTIKALAQPYAGHPGFREEWRA